MLTKDVSIRKLQDVADLKGKALVCIGSELLVSL